MQSLCVIITCWIMAGCLTDKQYRVQYQFHLA